MHLSKDYWFVRQLSSNVMFWRWQKLNPRPAVNTKEAREEYWAREREARADAKKTAEENRVKLKAAGYHRDKDFPITQEKKARAYAARVTKETGVEMDVCKGCYLSF